MSNNSAACGGGADLSIQMQIMDVKVTFLFLAIAENLSSEEHCANSS